KTRLLRRRILERRRYDGYLAEACSDRNTEAEVLTVLILFKRSKFFRREEFRVRIERAQHAVDCAIDRLVRINLGRIFLFDKTQQRGEELQRTAVVLRWPLCCSVDGLAKDAAQHGGHNQDNHEAEDRA